MLKMNLLICCAIILLIIQTSKASSIPFSDCGKFIFIKLINLGLL